MPEFRAEEEFEQLILHKTAPELMHFLLALRPQEVASVRHKTLELRKKLLEERQIGEVTWGRTGTNSQLEMLFLASLRTYSGKEARSIPFANETWLLNPTLYFNSANGFMPHSELLGLVLQLLAQHTPHWLDGWLGNTDNNRTIQPVELEVLLKLEHHGHIRLMPRILASAGVLTLVKYGTEVTMLNQLSTYESRGVALTDKQKGELGAVQSHYENPTSDEAFASPIALIAHRIATTPALTERAVPLFFEFDIQLDSVSSFSMEDRTWTRITWREIIIQLLVTGHLDRADILTRCLLALRRDFRRPLLTWFRNLFLALQPTPAEILSRQADFVELLPHTTPLVANFALDQLYSVLLTPGFHLAALLPGAGQLGSRPELKTGLRKLLAGLPKLLKQDAGQAPAVATLLAAALPHPDGAVQQAAAKGLAGLLTIPTPLLGAKDMAALISVIAGHAVLLGPPARAVLAAWLDVAPAETAVVSTAAYAPIGQFVPDISLATAIAPVRDWHELLFLTGQVLRHDDPAAAERWLDGLLRLHRTLPNGHTTQLRPYLVQLLPQLKTATEAEVTALLQAPVGLFGHQGLAQAMLLSWLTGFAVPRVGSVQVAGPHTSRTPLGLVEHQRYQWTEALLRTRQALPLLSTPTHAPAWVTPDALVARLLAYQAAGQLPNTADLAVALARTAHAHADTSTVALRQVPKLADLGLRALLSWFLGPAGQPLPALPAVPGPGRAASLQSSVAEALPELWAVAVRTKSPAASFPELSAALGYDHPGATQPTQAGWRTEQREQTRRETHLPGQPTTTTHYWTELRWGAGPEGAPPSPLLLYAAGTNANEHGSWEHNQALLNDFPFFAALLPNAADSLYAYVLGSAAWADNLEASERDLVALALRQLLATGPAFAMAESALLASGLIHHAGLCRSLAQEVVLRAVAHGRLLPTAVGEALGHQLAAGYAPVPRLTDVLKPLQGLDGLTDDALRQLLDALLPTLPDKPLRGLSPLLETYASLRAGSTTPLQPAVGTRLQAWRQSTSLKALSDRLLN